MGVWLSLVLVASVRDGPADPVGVAGANVADDCQFPGVVAFRAGDTSCSGSIVHPRVMVTAAHCLASGVPGRVRFGESYSGYERRSDIERCEIYPAFVESQAAGDDFAYCVLVDPVEELAPVPLLAGCEIEHLQEGAVAAIVGFGVPEDGGSFGRKRYAFTTLASELRSDATIAVGDDDVSGCIGDSGGPTLVQLPDGTWRVVGVLSRGPGCGAGASTYRVLADGVDWIEESSGFDVTPCFDDEGTWSASAECDAFDVDPRLSDDGWDRYCDGQRIAPLPTCESPHAGTSSGTGDSSSSSADDAVETSTSAMLASPSDEGCGCAAQADARGEFSHAMWVAVVLLARVRAAKRRRTSRKRVRIPARHVMLRARASAREIAGGRAGNDVDELVRAAAQHDAG